jgi:hypothetical protein
MSVSNTEFEYGAVSELLGGDDPNDAFDDTSLSEDAPPLAAPALGFGGGGATGPAPPLFAASPTDQPHWATPYCATCTLFYVGAAAVLLLIVWQRDRIFKLIGA